jgi:hypothetical protein
VTFPLVYRNMMRPYKRSYHLRTLRDLALAATFLSPFLGLIRLEYVYLTLIPCTIFSLIIVYNLQNGGAASTKDPIVIRDGFIEVDNYPSIRAAWHDDRFIELDSIQLAEVEFYQETTFYRHGARSEPKAEMRRMVLHDSFGRTYTIDRSGLILKNAVKALNAWNESESKRLDQRQKEGNTPSLGLCIDDGQNHSGIGRWRKALAAVIPMSLIPLMILVLSWAAKDQEGRSDGAFFVFLVVISLFSCISVISLVLFAVKDGGYAPVNVKGLGVSTNEESITVRFQSGAVRWFPWETLRGVMATSNDEYPHPFVLDSLFYDPSRGFLVFDGFLIQVSIDLADKLQSAYLAKFGYYPQKFWYTTGEGGTDNYSLLVKRPGLKRRPR